MRMPIRGRTAGLTAALLILLTAFAWVALRSGPLASVPVTVTTVQSESITPGLFGIGTVEARNTYRIGPVVAGRVLRIDVDIGDTVVAGQLLGEMDPVDLDQRVRAQEAALRRGDAQVREAQTRRDYASSQSRRYDKLQASRSVSEEMAAARRQELQIAEAGLVVAREELLRAHAEHQAVVALRSNLRLISPIEGLVVARAAEPGSTVVAGQAVVEVVDPRTFWVNARFDQISAGGLVAGLAARITLRSRANEPLVGRVARVEPRADPVTEETQARISFDFPPQPVPPLGELVAVEIALPALPAAPVVPDAAIHTVAGTLGVWRIEAGGLRLTPVQPGQADLDGRVQIHTGLADGDRVVVYSQRVLNRYSRIDEVDRLPGASTPGIQVPAASPVDKSP